MRVVYDGTFEGFLTIVYELYYQKLKPTVIEKSALSYSLFDEVDTLVTDETKALKVLQGLQKWWSRKNLQTILNTFMCDSKSFEMDLLKFIRLGFKDEKELQNINHTSVFAIRNLEKEFFRHYHRMTGFVRFQELEDETLYAKIEGKFNTLYYLGEHFSKRFNNQKFIIHDIERGLAFVHNQESKGIHQVADFDEPIYSSKEEKFLKLWKTFFKSVAIESRTNPKLQQSFVPLIYRTYMSEFG
ncbi:MAG: TIGR03915 family putative DNA repair protein [Epsilonproteobacteria bacterium]|nr:TIGR03915 family putative DNA repair protein [Campylobacterota bacterium]